MKAGMFAIACAVFTMAGCASFRGAKDEPAVAAEKTRDAEADLCKDLAKNDPAVRNFPQVDSLTPLMAIRQASDDLAKAVQEVQSKADDLNNPEIRAVQAAYEQLQNTVNAIPGGRSTVGESAPAIDSEARDLQISWDRLKTQLQCGA